MSRRSTQPNRYEEEEEDDDDDYGPDDYEPDGFVVDDEDEEDAYVPTHKTKKKAKTTRNMFIDDAAVDSEGEDDEYESEGEDGFIEYDNEPQASSSRSSHYTHQPMIEEEESAEVIADRFNKKYLARNDNFRPEAGMSQRSVFPTASDPSLWMLKCKPGKEKDIILALVKRSFSLIRSGNTPLIQSAFFKESLKGYIYIESSKAVFVQQAVEKITDLYGGKVTLVPRKEMVDVVEVKNKVLDVKPGDWARVKRGKYMNDLCQILRISDTQEVLRVKLIPRLDLTSEPIPQAGSGDKRAAQSTVRPPQRVFSRRDVEMANTNHGPVVKSRGYYLYNNEMFKDGFLEKDMKIVSLIVTNVNPTYDEITNFANAVEDETAKAKVLATLTAPLIAAQRQSAQLNVGDFVEIVDGNMSTISGVLEKIEGDTATITPQLRGLQKLSVPLNKVRKQYRDGDHVKVISGKFKGESGSIVKVVKTVATIISDNNARQIQVFTKDLGESVILSASETTLAKFSVLDIVQLDHHTVGIVVKISNGKYRVLDQEGSFRELGPQLITPFNNTRRTVAVDSRNNPINVGDQVKTTHLAGRQGTILHIAKTVAFIKAKETLDDAGVFVEKTHFLLTLTPSFLKTPQTNLMQPRPQGHTPGSSRPNDGFAVPRPPQNNFRGRGGSAVGRGGGGRRFLDPLINKTVLIRLGPYKGLLGIVKDVIENLARIELHTTFRTVSVDKNNISLTESGSAPQTPNNSWETRRQTTQASGWGGGGGGRTPHYSRDGSVSSTPSYNSSHRKPTSNFSQPKTNWGSGRTPHHQASQQSDDWANDFTSKPPTSSDNSSWFTPAKSTEVSWDDSNPTWNDWGAKESNDSNDWNAPSKTPNKDKPWTPQASNSWGTPQKDRSTSSWDTPQKDPVSSSWDTPQKDPVSSSWDTPQRGKPSSSWDTPQKDPISSSWDTPQREKTSSSWDTPKKDPVSSSWDTPQREKPSSTWDTPQKDKATTSWDAQPSDNWGAPVSASNSDSWDSAAPVESSWDAPITSTSVPKDSDSNWASDSTKDGSWEPQPCDDWGQKNNSWTEPKSFVAAPTTGTHDSLVAQTPGNLTVATPGGALMSSLAPLGAPNDVPEQDEEVLAPKEDSNFLNRNWFAPSLIVVIGPNRITGERPPHNGKEGRILSVDTRNRTCSLAPIEIAGTDEINIAETTSIDWACLLPTVPRRRQRLYVMTGERSGEFGVTVGQDATHHYCRMDLNNALITLSSNTLCGAHGTES